MKKKIKITIATAVICTFLAIVITSCQIPQFWQAADDVLTQTAVEVSVDKSAIQANSTLNIAVDITPAPSR